MDEMTRMLRPECVTLMDGLQDMDTNSKDGKDIGATLEASTSSAGSSCDFANSRKSLRK
jgi:hypothetical protein